MKKLIEFMQWQLDTLTPQQLMMTPALLEICNALHQTRRIR